jgi:hypothetical protein
VTAGFGVSVGAGVRVGAGWAREAAGKAGGAQKVERFRCSERLGLVVGWRRWPGLNHGFYWRKRGTRAGLGRWESTELG